MYNLIHCTSNKEGFKLYKKSAWKVFGNQSSTKNSPESEQLSFDSYGIITNETDESCFHVSDISRYLQQNFKGRKQVQLTEMWELLDDHPIFPSEGYRNEIKKDLSERFGAKIEQIVSDENGKKETVIFFSL
jgi:hypothetical protein